MFYGLSILSVPQILGIAIAKGQLSQSVNCRLASCKLLGKIAPKFETYWWVDNSLIIVKNFKKVMLNLEISVDYDD